MSQTASIFGKGLISLHNRRKPSQSGNLTKRVICSNAENETLDYTMAPSASGSSLKSIKNIKKNICIVPESDLNRELAVTHKRKKTGKDIQENQMWREKE